MKKIQKRYLITKRAETRELLDLTQRGVFKQVGITGKGTFYITPKRLVNAP